MLKALEALIRQIRECRRRRLDRGRQDPREQVRDLGFDAQTEEYVDMVAKGISRSRQGGAHLHCRTLSVAGLLVTTEAMVAELPKEPASAMPGGGGACEWAAWA